MISKKDENINVVIIDDESNSRELLKTFLTSYCTNVHIVGEAEDVESGISIINKTMPDLLLLDIEMDGGTGFDILSEFRDAPFLTCFVTGYDQYAIKAIKAGAFDYLLKPVNIQEIKEVIKKAKKIFADKKESSKPSLILNESGKYNIIKIDEIIKVEVDGNFSFLYLINNKRVISSEKLGYFEEILPSNMFYRTHKSHIINHNFIVEIEKGRTGNVKLSDKSIVPIASRRIKHFLEHLDAYKKSI